MAVLTRSALIARGVVKAGRKGQSIDLTIEFDEILRNITKEYGIWIPLPRLGTVILDQSSMVMPSDFRSRDYFIMDTGTGGSPITMRWKDPLLYFQYIKTLTSAESNRPRIYTVQKNHNRLYFYPPADQSYNYELSYSAIHPKVGLTLAFTSGGTYEIKVGDTITGATSAKTAVVDYVHVTSGAWSTGDAAGILIISIPSGAFAAENLNVGANLNVATIAATQVTADNFQHFLGEDFDDTIILGMAWKCSELISDLRERAPYWQSEYFRYLQDAYDAFKTTTILVRPNVWNKRWNKRAR